MLGVDVEGLLPGLAAIGGHEDAAFLVGAGVVAERADVGDVGVEGIEGDAGDVVGVLEAEVAPGLAAVERFVDAVAEANAVAGVGLAGAEPDDVGVMRVDGDIADGDSGLVIEDGGPGGAGVGGFEEAAGRGGDVDELGDGRGCLRRR